MIASDVDGLSRRNYDAGVLLGIDVRQFLPMNLFRMGCCGRGFGRLVQKLDGYRLWFERGQQPGVHIWAPPPAVALIALKELSRSRHKRPSAVTHEVLIPQLLWDEEWRTCFEKEMDVWFILHNGSIWPHFAFEPLMVGIAFPILSPSSPYPWQVKQEWQRVVDLGHALSKMSKTSDLRVRYHLRELLLAPRTFPGL